MLFTVMALLLSATPLDASAVKTTLTRRALTTVPQAVAQLPSDATLGEADAPVLEALEARFRSQAAKHGLKAFQPPAAREQGLVVAGADQRPSAPRDLISVQRELGADVVWSLTSNELHFARVGNGCCPACPCSPNGNCAPCMACRDRAPCDGVTTGVQVTVRSKLHNRKLLTEEVLVETIDVSSPLAAPLLPVVRLARVEVKGDEALAAFLRARSPALQQCARKSQRQGVAVFSYRRSGVRLSEVRVSSTALEKSATDCLVTVLGSFQVPPGVAGSLELEFSAPPTDE